MSGVRDWLASLDDQARTDLARRYAAAASAGGATVRTPDGRTVPIPPLLTPEPIARAQRTIMESDAHALVAALTRLTRWLLGDAGAPERARLFASFSPVEAELLSTWREAERLATARVDYFVDDAGRHRALEVNATIPAMQGYSDVIAEAFLRTVGAARGHDDAAIAALLDENGRNTDDLLAALVAHWQLLGGRGATPTIAIIHRDGDAQIGELSHYARRFAERGCETILATPAAVRLDDSGALRVAGAPRDLVYRHVFARRLEPGSDFARALREPARHRILNPAASHLEVKGMLGLLSAAGADTGDGAVLAKQYGLDDDQRAAIARALPWTRVLQRGPARGPSGEKLADLVATVAHEGDRFVIKRSWDYGGKSVFLGVDHDQRARERAGQVMEAACPLDWPELVVAAARDPRDAWVVQELVRFSPRAHLVAGPDGAAWRDLYVDCSIYTNLGVAARPSGGASRAAPGKIVNILGGGGLAPLVLDEVLARM